MDVPVVLRRDDQGLARPLQHPEDSLEVERLHQRGEN